MSADSLLHHLDVMRNAIPCLTQARKGLAGRIAVIGGSPEYTGAPFFAAMAALRVGADLAAIYTHPSAAVPIKSYSPDVVVYPTLDVSTSLERWANAVVIGPGLGRSVEASRIVRQALICIREIPLVIDADALWILAHNVEARVEAMKERAAPIILTPNGIEMKRLCATLDISEDASDLAHSFGNNVIVLAKGETDVVAPGNEMINLQGCRKRVGGQGDILAGIVATFSAWMWSSHTDGSSNIPSSFSRIFSAVVSASVVTRFIANQACKKHGRALIASDILPCIGYHFSGFEENTNDFEWWVIHCALTE